MWFAIKRLSLGFFLIALTSSVLLVGDWHRRKTDVGRIPQVAVLIYASQPVLLEGAQGMIEGLAASGFIDGQSMTLKQYNAEGDLATVNTIARQITDGHFDLALTMSTPAMQAMANANKAGKVTHVFGLVADPFSAGVGINREDPLDHPKHLVGIGTLLPVANSFQLAREFFPGLKSVGVVWNPGESNSRVFTELARKTAQGLGIDLLEATADNSSAVIEAANSVISRGAQAIWVGGDNTVLLALHSIIATAKKARIPVFTITPGDPQRGTLFDQGANFHEIGKQTGELAAQILRGTDPATVPVRNVVPEKLVINKLALGGLADPWHLPEKVLAHADMVVDEAGVREKAVAATPQPQPTTKQAVTPLAKKWGVHLVEFNNVLDVEEAEHGVLAGLREAGLVEGRDYEVKIRNAQGDMGTVNSLIDAAVGDGADLLITLSTPTLQVALQRARALPIVFTYVASGVIAGAGRSDEDHLPNVTGVYLGGGYQELLAIVRESFPFVRTVGTLFVPSEVNSVFHKDQLVEAARKVGIEVVAVAASTSAEVPDAALSLCSRQIDALCQIPGNLTASSFPSIAQAARRARLPIFAFQSSQARAGAAVVLARDYEDGGREAGLMAARVMRGESPAAIPFQLVSRTKLIVNLEAARSTNLKLPPALIKRAEEVIGQ